MNIELHKSKIVNRKSKITITGSKSESNRLLLLQALYPEINIENLSNSDDSVLMKKALQSTEDIIDIHHAGTAMRFLTAFFSTQEGREIILTGSSRMQERPIQTLVEALQELGAEISYEKNHGFPPLKIKGKQLTKSQVTLKANISSQYISALLLVAPKLKNGLELILDGEITSIPYINMTLRLLDEIGVKSSFENKVITIEPKIHNLKPKTLIVESDWSSASYYYSIVALCDIGTEIKLSSYKENSFQGDSVLSKIYKEFGVQTTFEDNSIILNKTSQNQDPKTFDLNNSPDIAQTIVVTCFALGIGCNLSGLHTLKIKETDRLLALKIEIEKLGGQIKITEDSLQLFATKKINRDVAIATYHDHRMAMAFAPLALKVPIVINDADVVSKSYPSFWNDLKTLGFKILKT